MRKSPLILAAAAAAVLSSSPALAEGRPNPTPIVSIPGSEQPVSYMGAPAIQQPLYPRAVPQNPFMSTNPWGALHNDTYMSDTYTTAGPLGHAPAVSSTWLGTLATPNALVVGMSFDRSGLLVAAAIITDSVAQVGLVRLNLIDPQTLATLATYDLPSEPFTGTDFRPAGTYFYQDQQDRTVIGNTNREIMVISHTANSFTLDSTISVAKVIPADDDFEALQPDFEGHVWFASKGGIMGTVDLSRGKVLGHYKMSKKEKILNSMAADEDGGLFVASDYALYRFDETAKGKPKVTWRRTYDEGDRVKPGQVGLGTGTTPTLMGSKYVAIADNADPKMHVLVYQRAKNASGSRLVCSVPVFTANQGSTENSLIGTDRAIVVENNYGYNSPDDTTGGKTTMPGITRINVSSKGKCTKAWTNYSVSIPTVVSKMSVSNGLIYTYTKPAGPGTTDAWYFTAMDFATGNVVYSRLAGTGVLYNNHYAPVYLGPDGAAYVGVVGGIVKIRDVG